MSQTDNEPEIVHVWVTRIKGTEETVSVRATRDRAEEWVEDQVNDPEAEWVKGPGGKDLYRSDGASVAGMVALCPVPDCIGLIATE
jgi:hypothetical protein